MCTRVGLLLLLLFAQTAFAKDEKVSSPGNTVLPKIWRGEIIEEDQGLVGLYSIMIDTQVKHRNGDFSFLLRGRKTKILYNFSVRTQEPNLPPNQYWRIREDTYDLVQLNYVDEFGKARSWKGTYPKALIVSSQALNSLGIWYIVTLKDEHVRILLKPLVFKAPLARWKGAVQSVTDAFTGSVTSRYVPELGGEGQGIRKVLRGVRSIEMQYKLDLFKLNTHAPEMAKVLQANDADIRSCYTDLLDKEPSAKGNLIYSFVYSGNEQSIKSLKIKQSNIPSPDFKECLYFKIRGLSFPLRHSLAGELSFQFNFME